MSRPDVLMAGDALTETAFAKINLALHVRGRRDDGYHSLESLFVFAADGDRLHAVLDHHLRLKVEGPFAQGLETDADNLVLRAAIALRDFAEVREGARLVLDKRLPVASGIGGGSADAAATLRLLIRLWGLDVDEADLLHLALSLGSDVPACLASRTQFVGGRGEELREVEIAGLRGKAMLLVNPRAPLSTGKVFARWDGVDRGALEPGDMTALVEQGRNDLEPAAIALAPVIADVLTALRAQPGVQLVRMSGSGATCFALFADAAARNRARYAVQAAQPGWWVMATEIGDR
ncbi:MAG: 4-(cytidine 5'-diphospho)-2-C-methyl-D-erythritol kinase [Sphingobium sp.]